MKNNESHEGFPPLPEGPKQPWVKALLAMNKIDYEQTRQSDIEAVSGGVSDLLRSIADFDGASDEAVGYIALRIGTAFRNQFEDGFQQGLDIGKSMFQAKQERYHMSEVMRLGGWG